MSEAREEPTFELPVYSRRYDREDTYRVRLTPTGWHIAHLVHTGDCDPTGQPHLFNNFKQDYIRPPATIDISMRSLWHEASAGTLSRDEIQQKLNAIGREIEESERRPRGKRRR